MFKPANKGVLEKKHTQALRHNICYTKVINRKKLFNEVSECSVHKMHSDASLKIYLLNNIVYLQVTEFILAAYLIIALIFNENRSGTILFFDCFSLATGQIVQTCLIHKQLLLISILIFIMK